MEPGRDINVMQRRYSDEESRISVESGDREQE